MSKLRQAVIPLLVVGTILVVLFYGVFPTRLFFEQRSDIGQARAELVLLENDNEGLKGRLVTLTQPAEIERLARSEYNLVYPGEEAYAVLPAAPEPIEIPDLWPLNALITSLSE